jgi:hypothetical protein
MAVIVNKEEEGRGGVSEVQLPSTQQVAQQDFRNRFKIVKVETTEPLKRGRWTCFDFVDKPAAKDKAPAPEVGDKTGKAAAVGAAAAGAVNVPLTSTAGAPSGPKIVSSRPASSMARELGALHETTTATSSAIGEDSRMADMVSMAGQAPPVRQAAAVATAPVGSSSNPPVSVGGGGVVYSSAAGGGFPAGPGGATVQQQLQQPQVSPPVTSLPQVRLPRRISVLQFPRQIFHANLVFSVT